MVGGKFQGEWWWLRYGCRKPGMPEETLPGNARQKKVQTWKKQLIPRHKCAKTVGQGVGKVEHWWRKIRTQMEGIHSSGRYQLGLSCSNSLRYNNWGRVRSTTSRAVNGTSELLHKWWIGDQQCRRSVSVGGNPWVCLLITYNLRYFGQVQWHQGPTGNCPCDVIYKISAWLISYDENALGWRYANKDLYRLRTKTKKPWDQFAPWWSQVLVPKGM